MHAIKLLELPDTAICIGIYTNVENAAEIRSRLLAGDTNYSYGFIDAEMICSFEHVMSAVYRAVRIWNRSSSLQTAASDAAPSPHSVLQLPAAERCRTKSVHSEILYSLSATRNISEALKTFGISDSSRHVIIVRVLQEPYSCGFEEIAHTVTQSISKILQGHELHFSLDNDPPVFKQFTHLQKVIKLYKIPSLKAKSQDEICDFVSRTCVGAIALKGY